MSNSIKIPTVAMKHDTRIIVQTDTVSVFIRSDLGRLVITDRIGNMINFDTVKDSIRKRDNANEVVIVK